MLRDLYIVSIN